MPLSEQQYIGLCKKLIEEKFSFGNGHGYTQRDLEILSEHIEEKTGIYISLSTLKRFWKNNFKQGPQLATLNALVAVLDYKDWHAFKQHNRQNVSSSKRILKKTFIGVGVVVITLIIVGALYNTGNHSVSPREPKINGPVIFTAEKTITSGIPNTVIFNYDVSNVKADSFFIQQTWNDYHRVRIDPNGNAYSSIYYESGFHRARLIANDTEIAMQPIHILSNGWEPHIYYSEEDLIPIDFKNDTFINNGQLQLDESLLEKQNIDQSKYFYTRITNSQEFNVSSDNFSFVTRMKVDSLQNSLCRWATLIIVTDVHIFSVSLQKRGCERYVGYKLGEIVRDGENNDLAALGCDIYKWQEVGIKVRDKNAEIHMNGKTAFKEVFKKDFGMIVGLIYIFEGTGSIDYARLSDTDGQIVFEDDFERV